MKLEAQFMFRNQVWLNVYKTPDNKFIETAVYSGEDYSDNLISISNQIGCPVQCSFCLVGRQGFSRNITPEEYVEQVELTLDDPRVFQPEKPIKVSFTRAGEPLLNPHTSAGLEKIAKRFAPRFKFTSVMPNTLDSYVSLTQMKETLKSYSEEFQFNVSMHTTDELRRSQIIPYNHLMSFKEIAKFGEQWVSDLPSRKVNLSFVMMDKNEIEIKKINKMFSPKYFAIRLALYLPCTDRYKERFQPSQAGRMKDIVSQVRDFGYLCIESVAKETEQTWHTSPGSGMLMRREN